VRFVEPADAQKWAAAKRASFYAGSTASVAATGSITQPLSSATEGEHLNLQITGEGDGKMHQISRRCVCLHARIF